MNKVMSMEDVIREFCEEVTLTRSGGQIVRKGKLEDNVENTETIEVTIVPLEQEKLELLPEGSRNSGGVAIYSACELRTAETAEGKSPDIITTVDGTQYKINSVNAWISHACYYECTATRITR